MARPNLRKQSDQLLLRKLGPLKQRLRRRAEQNGHSMEEEARNILRNALKDQSKPEKGLGTRIAERFKGIELPEDIPQLRIKLRVPKFD
jgi:plasmid stability protein